MVATNPSANAPRSLLAVVVRSSLLSSRMYKRFRDSGAPTSFLREAVKKIEDFCILMHICMTVIMMIYLILQTSARVELKNMDFIPDFRDSIRHTQTTTQFS